MNTQPDHPAQQAPNRFERHPLVTALCLAAFAAVLLLAVAEWILAGRAEVVKRPGSTASLFQHRSLIVREWQPNREHRFGTPMDRRAGSDEPVRDWYRLEIDSMGFIRPSLVHETPDMEIAFVGGSTTECLYMLPEERFPYVSGRLLEARTGLRINSINAGKSGNNSMHSLIVYLGKIAPLKPRYVLLLNAANDVA
ncbi:MAG: SGNH/GDSL hydrolase family protein, partial [Pseudomonadota bacterium]|nr:SGNH/GDSL hydrolase family protein [Pseudomonadota bacterium]